MLRCLTCGSLLWEMAWSILCPCCEHSGVDRDPEDML